MTSREKINKIFALKGTGDIGFWTGNPHEETVPIYEKALGVTGKEGIYTALKDDCRWLRADLGYRPKGGIGMFDPSPGVQRHGLSSSGCFVDITELSQTNSYPWPSLDNFDYTNLFSEIDEHQEHMIFSGFWSPFFHQMADFFGMQEYFIKMYTDPRLISGVTDRIVDFYVEASDIFLTKLGDRADIVFFGNDLGTQRDCFLAPDIFEKFVLPGMKRIIDVAKKHGKYVMLHSCGSVHKIIPQLIDAGIDGLHPLQAKAEGMDAVRLSQYKNDIAFVGGIDTQDLLVHGSPQEIKDEVHRVRDTLGNNLIISPSHEYLLPNVSIDNVIAMSEAAKD